MTSSPNMGPAMLVDKRVAYARQLLDQSDLPAGSFESNLARRGVMPCRYPLDGARPSAMVRNSLPSGKLVGSWMRAMCSITRAPTLIRRSRRVLSSAFASGCVSGMASRTASTSQNALGSLRHSAFYVAFLIMSRICW
jgi:hypothetical protein